MVCALTSKRPCTVKRTKQIDLKCFSNLLVFFFGFEKLIVVFSCSIIHICNLQLSERRKERKRKFISFALSYVINKRLKENLENILIPWCNLPIGQHKRKLLVVLGRKKAFKIVLKNTSKNDMVRLALGLSTDDRSTEGEYFVLN